MPAAHSTAMLRRWLPLLAAIGLATGLGACVCQERTLMKTAYASMASYSSELIGCITLPQRGGVRQSCPALCSAVFQIAQGDVTRCELTSFDSATPIATPGPMSTPEELAKLRGATVQGTYVEHAQCDDGGGWWDFGWIDGSSDDGSYDDGGSDDGGYDGSDDGSDDDGGYDGSGDDGGDGGDDGGGGGDDGGGSDGGGALTGGTTSGHHAPVHGTHAAHASPSAAHTVRRAGASGRR